MWGNSLSRDIPVYPVAPRSLYGAQTQFETQVAFPWKFAGVLLKQIEKISQANIYNMPILNLPHGATLPRPDVTRLKPYVSSNLVLPQIGRRQS